MGEGAKGGGGGGGGNGWMDEWMIHQMVFHRFFFCTHGQNAIALAKNYDAIY